MDFSGKTALVTGASRGIGKAVAHRLAGLGANVVLCARSLADVQGVVDAIHMNGGEAMGLACDVGDFRMFETVVGSAVERFGGIDILVNNAGTIEPISLLSESDPEAWSRAVDVNLKGVYFGMRLVIPLMVTRGGGTVVNLSSGAANSQLEGWSHYCATKAGVKKLTECVHREMASQGIRVLGLSPGTVATDMMARIKSSGVNPVSQLDWEVHISPEDVAEAVVFLCSPRADGFCGTDFSLKNEEGRRLAGLEPRSLN